MCITQCVMCLEIRKSEREREREREKENVMENQVKNNSGNVCLFHVQCRGEMSESFY